MASYEKTVAFWHANRIRTDTELAEAMNAYSISFAYHSGRIENESVTFDDTREIFEHDRVTSYTGDLRTLFEISNAKDANRYLLESFGKTRPLEEALIKGFQRLLTQNTYDAGKWQLGERPGEYSKHRYVPGKI